MTPKNCEVLINQDRLRAIEVMSTDMFNCPHRRRGRTYKEVYTNTYSGKILEYALEDQGGVLNPKEFNEKDRDSYCWDVTWNSLRTEVKRKKFIGSKVTFYSWYSMDYVRTFLKNTDYVEQLIVGDYKLVGPHKYKVEWMFITPVLNNFKQYIQKSMYNEGQMIYNHRYDPNCKYLMEVV
jgi:hypothetical protein